MNAMKKKNIYINRRAYSWDWCLCSAFGNYMRFDLFGAKKNCIFSGLRFNFVSLSINRLLFLLLLPLCAAILIVICEHKRINVFMFLRDHFIYIWSAQLVPSRSVFILFYLIRCFFASDIAVVY